MMTRLDEEKSRKNNLLKTVRQERKGQRFVGLNCLGPGVGHLYLNSR